MQDWNRSTHESSLENFSSQVTTAIHQHLVEYQLGQILSNVLICLETKSEKVKKGLFGGTGMILTDLILTPAWLLWAMVEVGESIRVISARLADIVVVDYSKSSMAKLIPDTGIDVTGEFTGVTRWNPSELRGSIFMGVENNSAGIKFLDMLIKSVEEAKK